MTIEYTKYRVFLAWIGFITLYVIVPVTIIYGITALNTQAQAAADRATAAYNEVMILSEIRDTLNCAVYDDRDCFID